MKKKKYIILRANFKTTEISKKELEILNTVDTMIFKVENFSELNKYEKDHSIFDAQAVITNSAYISRDLIKRFNSLILISRTGTGVDHIDVDAATENGIIVANCPRFCVGEMADHIMAFLLTSNKMLFRWDKLFRKCTKSKKAWEEIGMQREKYPIRIAGKRLGLIGFGNISRAVSERAKPFGLEVWSYDPFVKDEVFKQFGVKKVDIVEIFKNCEFISVSIPFTEATYHMVDKKYFKMMKPEAIFINTARGEVVEEKDLIKALKEKWIAGVAIDVFEYFRAYGSNLEKVVSPYFELHNVILTPHIAACSVESIDEVKETSARNVVRVLQGYLPEDYVNKNVIPKYPLIKK